MIGHGSFLVQHLKGFTLVSLTILREAENWTECLSHRRHENHLKLRPRSTLRLVLEIGSVAIGVTPI